MEYKKISVSQFENCKSTIPQGCINIWKWLLIEPDCIQIINKIRSTSDKKLIRELKEKLPCVTMSGTFSERNSEKMTTHNGLICIDIDGKDNPYIENMEDLKLQLSKLPHVLYAGLSVGGKGLFVLIPIAYTEKHLEHYLAVEADFQSMGINIDSACKDITRLRYRSWDKKPIINLNATIYERIADTSAVVILPKNTTNKTKLQTSLEPQPIQVEEKVLSIEEQFLRPMIDENTVIQVTQKNEKEKVSDFIDFICSKKLDITKNWIDWFTIGNIIARIYRENGRPLFHEISLFYPDYSLEECNYEYDLCLQKLYKYHIRWLSEIASKYGISYYLN